MKQGLLRTLLFVFVMLAATALPMGKVAAADGTLNGKITGIPPCGGVAAPLANARVFIMNSSYAVLKMTTTDSLGNYTMTYPEGTYRIHFVADGYSSVSYATVTIPSAGIMTLNVELIRSKPCLQFRANPIVTNVPVDQITSVTLPVNNLGIIDTNMSWRQMDPPVQIIQEPSLENDTAAWEDVIDGDPNTVNRICSPDLPSAANSGNCFFYFASLSSEGTGHVSQTVTIPYGVADLSFWYGGYRCPGSGVYKLSVDGKEIWMTDTLSMTCTATIPIPYVKQVISLDEFADGKAHTIRFDYKAKDAEFLLDDIQIDSYRSHLPAWLTTKPLTATLAKGASMTELLTMSGINSPEGETRVTYLTVLPRSEKTPIVPVILTTTAQTEATEGVSGSVFKQDSCTGTALPVGGTWVEISDLDGLRAGGATMSDGSFRFSLAAGDYKVKVLNPGFSPVSDVALTVTGGQVTTMRVELPNYAPCLTTGETALGSTLLPGETGQSKLTVTNFSKSNVEYSLVEVAPLVQLARNPSAETPIDPSDWGVTMSTGRALQSCDAGTAKDGSCSFLLGSGAGWERNQMVQSDLIPVGMARLHFWYRLTGCQDLSDKVRLTVDSELAWLADAKDAQCDGGYLEAWVNVDQYADGGNHKLKFDYSGMDMMVEIDDIHLDSYAPKSSPWLSFNPGPYTAQPQQVTDTQLDFDTAGLNPGKYETLIGVKSWKVDLPLIPVTLVVGYYQVFMPAMMK